MGSIHKFRPVGAARIVQHGSIGWYKGEGWWGEWIALTGRLSLIPGKRGKQGNTWGYTQYPVNCCPRGDMFTISIKVSTTW